MTLYDKTSKIEREIDKDLTANLKSSQWECREQRVKLMKKRAKRRDWYYKKAAVSLSCKESLSDFVNNFCSQWILGV